MIRNEGGTAIYYRPCTPGAFFVFLVKNEMKVEAIKMRYLTAGESHGPQLTTIIEGVPAGLD